MLRPASSHRAEDQPQSSGTPATTTRPTVSHATDSKIRAHPSPTTTQPLTRQLSDSRHFPFRSRQPRRSAKKARFQANSSQPFNGNPQPTPSDQAARPADGRQRAVHQLERRPRGGEELRHVLAEKSASRREPQGRRLAVTPAERPATQDPDELVKCERVLLQQVPCLLLKPGLRPGACPDRPVDKFGRARLDKFGRARSGAGRRGCRSAALRCLGECERAGHPRHRGRSRR
jgi:hypothetical protein